MSQFEDMLAGRVQNLRDENRVLKRRIRELQKSNQMLRARARRNHEVDLFVRRMKGRPMSGFMEDAKVWMDDIAAAATGCAIALQDGVAVLNRIDQRLERLAAAVGRIVVDDDDVEPQRVPLRVVMSVDRDDE